MSRRLEFTWEILRDLLSGTPITDLSPWSSGDDHFIEDYLEKTCEAAAEDLATLLKVEAGHYGSGYASYVDAWFYKRAPEFSFAKANPGQPTAGMENVYYGLQVYLSRLSPYFVLMESWQSSTSGALPGLSGVDRMSHPEIVRLAPQVQSFLEARGFVRLYQNELAGELPDGLSLTTNLGNEPYTVFDALFYWND